MPRLRRVPPPSDDFDDDDECFREKPGQRNAANARERARMRILSKAFSRLKTTLPWVPADTKLSKLDTLRLATSYIAHLRTILTDGESAPVVHPLNLTWPFTIHSQAAADAAKSPDWSSEDNSPLQSQICRKGILSCLADSSSCGDIDDDRKDFAEAGERHFSDEKTYQNDGKCFAEHKNFSYLNGDHRHYSDSLLNIG